MKFKIENGCLALDSTNTAGFVKFESELNVQYDLDRIMVFNIFEIISLEVDNLDSLSGSTSFKILLRNNTITFNLYGDYYFQEFISCYMTRKNTDWLEIPKL